MQDRPDDLLILGGDGFIGTRLCELLVELSGGSAGPITVATRHPVRARHLLVLPAVDIAEVDVLDDDALWRLVAGRSTVVNLMGSARADEATLDRLHARLPWRLARVCESHRVQRLVHLSALGANHDARHPVLRSRALGEEAIRGAEVPGVVLRPSVVFGAHDHFTTLLAEPHGRRALMRHASEHTRVQPVWVDDLVRAIMVSLTATLLPGNTFDCAGPEVFNLGELCRQVQQWAGPLQREHEERVVPEQDEPLLEADSVASGGLPGLQQLGIRPTPMEAVVPAYLHAQHSHQCDLDEWRREGGPVTGAPSGGPGFG